MGHICIHSHIQAHNIFNSSSLKCNKCSAEFAPVLHSRKVMGLAKMMPHTLAPYNDMEPGHSSRHSHSNPNFSFILPHFHVWSVVLLILITLMGAIQLP